MTALDSTDIADALQTAAAFGGRKHPGHRTGDPAVAGERTVRRLRYRVQALLEQLPPDMSVDELLVLLTDNRKTDGDDE